MNRLIYILLFTVSISFSEIINDSPLPSVDCLILQDENSIICKYEHERIEEDKSITVQWVDPSGNISRERVLLLPAGHGSIYDFRYIDGREPGTWNFKVIDEEVETSTTFEIE